MQPKVDKAYAKTEEMPHPTVRTFLKDNERPRASSSESSPPLPVRTEPQDEACVICFTRPRTVGFVHGDRYLTISLTLYDVTSLNVT